MDELRRSQAGGVIAACEIDGGCKKLSCEVCLKEVPADAVKSVDAQDYVHHFCGLDCFEAWQNSGKHPIDSPKG